MPTRLFWPNLSVSIHKRGGRLDAFIETTAVIDKGGDDLWHRCHCWSFSKRCRLHGDSLRDVYRRVFEGNVYGIAQGGWRGVSREVRPRMDIHRSVREVFSGNSLLHSRARAVWGCTLVRAGLP